MKPDKCYSLKISEGISEWNSLLKQFRDANIYQTIAFAKLNSINNNITPYLIYYRNELVGMALSRNYIFPMIKYGIKYILNGPIFQKRGSQYNFEIFNGIITLLYQKIVAEEKNGLILKPYLFKNFFNESVQTVDNFKTINSASYKTFLLDLTPEKNVLRKQFKSKWRNHLNKAEKNNLEVVTGNSDEMLHNFLEIYYKMVKTKKFKPGIRPDKLININELLDENQKMQVFLCLYSGKVVSGVVASCIGEYGISILRATIDEGRNVNASYLLQIYLIEWMKKNHAVYYDQGGIDKIHNPSVFKFKEGLGGIETETLGQMQAGVSFSNTLIYLYNKYKLNLRNV